MAIASHHRIKGANPPILPKSPIPSYFTRTPPPADYGHFPYFPTTYYYARTHMAASSHLHSKSYSFQR